jgi:hypothetical protein
MRASLVAAHGKNGPATVSVVFATPFQGVLRPARLATDLDGDMLNLLAGDAERPPIRFETEGTKYVVDAPVDRHAG